MLEIAGKSYKSVRDACVQNHIKECTYYKRLRSGMTKEEALQNVNYRSIRPTYAKKKTVDGIVYPTTEKACEAFGISERTYYKRIRSGLSTEDALKEKIKGRIKETINGKTFPSRIAAVRYYGVNSRTVYTVMKKYQLSFVDALMEVVKRK